LIGSALHFLLCKKQIPAPYPINIGEGRIRKEEEEKRRKIFFHINQNGAE